MSSEAAQKAYPEAGGAAIGVRYKTYGMQVAFDRGAVEALRQALDMYKSNEGGFLYRLEALIDNWEAGQ